MTTRDTSESAPTVLIVEDEADVRQVVGLLLRRDGYRVLEAADGEEALVVLDAEPDVDLILLDVMMPRMTGPEAFPAIRERSPGMPVVFFSGYDRTEIAPLLQSSGAFTEFVGKPFSNRELLAVIRRGIATSRRAGPSSG